MNKNSNGIRSRDKLSELSLISFLFESMYSHEPSKEWIGFLLKRIQNDRSEWGWGEPGDILEVCYSYFSAA